MNNREAGRLAGRVAVVTGASSGIGRAIAVGLSREHVHVCAVGRNPAALAETVAAIRQSSEVSDFQIDLTVEGSLQPLLQFLEKLGRVDILIHSAGIIHQDLAERADIKDFDLQFAANVRAPYVLTQRLLPLLTVARGQIVFINSSAGLTAKRPEVGQYAATKHALRAITDSLREEVNPKGIRVLSLYLGRTATPMQEALYQQEGRVYNPEMLLQPEDVATIVVQALLLPYTAEVTDISIRPMRRPD
ncbi:MAG TPA: SDR family NAD(P)-dependent oxidoreductase [Candidatus Eisenbacteria bacterium]|nr:SDR family NAD(P)-dependent oxidoreductase [Candidatus Eisenbacteria bacterium]